MLRETKEGKRKEVQSLSQSGLGSKEGGGEGAHSVELGGKPQPASNQQREKCCVGLQQRSPSILALWLWFHSSYGW